MKNSKEIIRWQMDSNDQEVAGLKTCIAYCSLYLQHKIVHSITNVITSHNLP